MTDQLEGLFAELRAGTIPAVRPPGADAARRTVRRRRQTRSMAVAAAVLALAGGVAWSVHPVGRTVPAAGPAADLVSVAREAVARSADGPAVVEQAGLGAGAKQVTLPAGAYLLIAACAANASGMMLATVFPPEPADRLAVSWVPCDSAPAASRISVRVPKSGEITVDMAADITPGGQAGYAYRLVRDPTGPVEPSATTRANAARARQLVTAAGGAFGITGFTSEADQSAWVGRFRPQTAYLRLSCAGPGAVRVVVLRLASSAGPADPIVGTELVDRTLACTAAGVTIKVPVAVTAPSSLGVELRADAAARDKAGFATAIDLV